MHKIYLLLLLTIHLGYGCGKKSCPTLFGRWDDDSGFSLVFENDHQGIWLMRFGSEKIDTMIFAYALDCHQAPAQIDMTDFDRLPFKGKTVYGIIQQTPDGKLGFCFDLGSESRRPAVFDEELTIWLSPH